MKECIAMLLAGGQGSRLYALTRKLAKPAVPFGGKYRIIDFPLSNCVNSGIDTVGILTQYQPLVLNDYIGNGQPWDLDRLYGGVHVLPPYQTATGSDWYKGTANAIYQNINFIERYDPQYVVILSGDHIYKMDYSEMLAFHKEKGADCTIAVLEVPWEEAPRFGIMTADADGTITKFEEKPKQPQSNLASMGIYVFTWEKLRKYLVEDEADKTSSNDFGKNIIPNMLADNQKMVAWPFDGYWKDVGTIDSLWEANMDLLDPNPGYVGPGMENILPHIGPPGALYCAAGPCGQLHDYRGLCGGRQCKQQRAVCQCARGPGRGGGIFHSDAGRRGGRGRRGVLFHHCGKCRNKKRRPRGRAPRDSGGQSQMGRGRGGRGPHHWGKRQRGAQGHAGKRRTGR